MFGTVLFSTFCISQNQDEPKVGAKVENPAVNFALEGMIGVTVGEKAVGINVGGPSLKFKLKTFKIGVGAFPSLLILNGEEAPRPTASTVGNIKKADADYLFAVTMLIKNDLGIRNRV